MGNSVHSDSDFRDEFIEGAARAFFVTAYADFVEDSERDDGREYPQPGPGEDWVNSAPERTPPNAYALAGELWASLQYANGEAGVYSLSLRAEAADGEPPNAYDFGWCFGMQYMGHGVSWFDDHASFPCEIPYAEISFYSFDHRAFRAE